jgi:hypothetical protein
LKIHKWVAKLGNAGPMGYSAFRKVSQLQIHSIVHDACVHAHGNRVVQTNGYDVSKSMDFSNSRGSKRKNTNDNRDAKNDREANNNRDVFNDSKNAR